jgi:Signal recognition particle GTPase
VTRNLDIDDKALGKVESIIYSMTPDERANPELINPSRKRRIASGCGRDMMEVNQFLKQFEEMRKMMHRLSTGKGIPGMPGMGAPAAAGAGGARRATKRRNPGRRKKR